MELLLLSLYTGSLFFLVSVVAPVLLRTSEHKNLAGHFYGRILFRFYKIAFPLLVLYLILGKAWEGLVLLLGLSVNLGLSLTLRRYKRMLGNIENYSYNSPQRTKFRRMSYLSTALFVFNLLLALTILWREV